MRRRIRHPVLPTLLLAGIAVVIGPASAARAQDPDDDREVLAASPSGGEGYAEEGMEDCLACHDETSKYPVLSILATPHAVQGDHRTPLSGQHACQTCHGPSAAHAEDEDQPVGIVFGLEAPIGPQTEVCLGCHKGGERMNWVGSPHQSNNIPCAACHTIHAKEDRVLSKHMRPELIFQNGQPSVCFRCHQQQRAQVYRASSHPIREGLMECSDCHNPHGSMGPKQLKQPTVNETCYGCHAEKRGPFLWEHAPVREDCTNCHTPHGSNHPTLLKARMPFLCQQCHMAQFHPSTAYTGPNIPTGQADFHALDKSCANCHSEVHGSNHPSGVRWTR